MPKKRDKKMSEEDERKLAWLRHEVGLAIQEADRGEFSDRTIADIAREAFRKLKRESR